MSARTSTRDRGRLDFVLREIILPDGRPLGDALERDAWLVEEVFAPAFVTDAAGRPRFPLVYLELARGHMKTGGGAAIALAEVLLSERSTEVIVAAGDRDQAALMLEAIDGFTRRNPLLTGAVRARGDERLVDETGSIIRVIAADAPTAWGHAGRHERFRLLVDELTTWKGDALWEALASATIKVPDAQTIVLSNAGFDPSDRSWQWRIRSTAERESWAHLYSAPGIVASWITPAQVERMRSLLPPSAFDRVVLNRWTSGAGDFVTAAQWARCVDLGLRPAGRGAPAVYRHVGGLDLGLTRDRTAFAVGHRVRGGAVVLDELLVWQGSRGEPVSIAAVEMALVDAAQRFPGLVVYCDPWQLQGSLQRLPRLGVRMQEFTFGASSVQRLSKALFHAIATAGLRVFPDPELEQEILGLRVLETASGWRFDHRAGGFSDRAVALAMVVHALAGTPEPGAVPPRMVLPITGDLDERLGAPMSTGNLMRRAW